MESHPYRSASMLSLVLAAALCWGCSRDFIAQPVADAAPAAARATPAAPSSKAQPLRLQGVSNFHKVADGLYRGAQPSKEGFKNLQAMGVKTVVNLRDWYEERDQLPAEMNYVRVPANAFDYDVDEVVSFLQAAIRPENQPVFVHCHHGSDRTGMMVAAYRMVVQDWDKEQAIAEMTDGGFGFHHMFQNLPRALRNMDVAAVRAKVQQSGGPTLPVNVAGALRGPG